MLVVLWQERQQWLRMLFLVFGGLSNPLIFPTTLMIGARCLIIERKMRELVFLAAAIAISAIQYDRGAYHIVITLHHLRVSIDKFAGFFFIGSYTMDNDLYAGCGFVVLGGLALIAWYFRGKLDRWFLVLVALYGIVCATVAMRGPVDIYHPYVAGPRYFLYAYTLLIWIGVWLASCGGPFLGAAFAFALLAAVVPGLPKIIQRDAVLSWRRAILDCSNSSGSVMEIPIQYNGSAADTWKIKLSGDDCRSLLKASLF